MLKITFESREVIHLVGIPERALRYWADRRIVVPDIADAVGRPGIRRKYSFENLVQAGLVKEILSYGINLHETRDILAFLKRSLFFRYQPGQFFLVIEGGVAKGALFGEMGAEHEGKLKRQYPKWMLRLGQGREDSLGKRFEQMMDVADADSLLIVAVHRIRNQLARRIKARQKHR